MLSLIYFSTKHFFVCELKKSEKNLTPNVVLAHLDITTYSEFM